jgi:hypothetical protein
MRALQSNLPVNTDAHGRSSLRSHNSVCAGYVHVIRRVLLAGGSAILPIPGAPTLMRNREDCHISAKYLVHHGVREMLEVVVPGVGFVCGPVFCRLGQSVDGLKQLHSEGVGGNWAPVKVLEECLACLCLRFGQHFDVEGTHRELRRCRTSAQGAACTRPARNSARRRFTSARHNSETVASSAVSRLSSRATANAERSSTGRPRTSSSRWSTRAFMEFSLALRVRCGKGSMDNMSIDTDQQQQKAASPQGVVVRSSSR